MKPKQITHTYTWAAVCIQSLYVLMALFLSSIFILQPLENEMFVWYILLTTAVVMAVIALKEKRMHKAVLERFKQYELLEKKFKTNDIKLEMAAVGSFSLTSLDNKLDIRNPYFYNRIDTKSWSYADFSYDMYRKAKHGEYKYSTTYYSVMMIKLPRILPNVLFDSKISRKRQFKMQFDQSQRHSLEGNFDNYFDTYFPNFYTIDSMSFITPEVMQSLIDASDYDIEISGDCLFLYGNLQEMENQIQDMQEKATIIKEKLLHNILTYRDERLPNEKGRETVTNFAFALWRNLTRDYIEISVWGILFISSVAAQIIAQEFNPFYSLIFFFSLMVPLRRLKNELTRRRQDVKIMNITHKKV